MATAYASATGMATLDSTNSWYNTYATYTTYAYPSYPIAAGQAIIVQESPKPKTFPDNLREEISEWLKDALV